MIKEASGEYSLQIVEPREIIVADTQLGVSASDIMHVHSVFRPLGIWRLEIDTGLVWFSKAAFEIFEIDYENKAVDFPKAAGQVAAKCRDLFLKAVEDAASQLTGFDAVIALNTGLKSQQMVQINCLYREVDERRELYGVVAPSQMSEISVRILAENPLKNAIKLG